MIEIARFAALIAATALLAIFPGWLLVGRMDPGASPARRRALALVIGPAALGVLVHTIGGVSGLFLSPALVVATALAAIVALGRDPRSIASELRDFVALERGAADRLPLALALFTLVYFFLVFDSMFFHTLGVNGPVMHVLGYGLGEGAAAPPRNAILGWDLPVPEGQLPIPETFAALFAYPGLRLFFAGTILAFAALVFHAVLACTARRRLATLVATLAVLSPFGLDLNQVDSLVNLWPALWLGVALLLATSPTSRPWAVGLAVGALGASRHVALVAAPVALALLARERPGSARSFAAGFLPVLAWIALHHGVAGRGAVDEGLYPVAASGAGWTWSFPWEWPGARVPYTAWPAWLALPGASLARIGLVAGAAMAFGAWRARRERWLGWALALGLAPSLLLLFREPVLLAAQLDRLVLVAVPASVALAVALGAFRDLPRGRRVGVAVVALALGLVLPRALRALPADRPPPSAAASAAMPWMLPEPAAFPPFEHRRTLAELGALPGWRIDQLFALVGADGKRPREALRELREPRFEDRYVSMEEKVLSLVLGERFRGSWLPAHPRHRPDAQPRGEGDPYLEREPKRVRLDLSRAIEGAEVGFRLVDDDDDRGGVEWDMAGDHRPLRLDGVRLTPDGPVVDLLCFKEYFSKGAAEVAFVVFPRFDVEAGDAPPPDDVPLIPGGHVTLSVPGRSFLSYVQVHGMRRDRIGLLVGLEWHAWFTEEGTLQTEGPFRQ